MSDDPRADARLRAALLTLPAPDPARTHVALAEVLDRSARRTGTVRHVVPLAVAAVLLAVLVLLPVVLAGRDRQEAPPATPDATALEGTWQRDVSGAGVDGWNGPWRILLDRSGVLGMIGPRGGTVEVDGASYRVVDDRVLVDPFVNDVCADTDPGAYRWQVEGSRLVLTVVDDPCTPRAAVLEGTWTRR